MNQHTTILSIINTTIHTNIYEKLTCCEVNSNVFCNIYYVYVLLCCFMQIFRIVMKKQLSSDQEEIYLSIYIYNVYI